MLGDSMKRGRKPGPVTTVRPKQRDWRAWLVRIPLALIVPFAIGYLLSVFVFFPPREAAGAGIDVPDLIGRTAGEAERELSSRGLGRLVTSELPHPSAPTGQVVAQSPLPGQQLRAGADVRVALSSGRPRGLVPDVTGFSAERAEALLRRLGFDVSRADEESFAPTGRVVRTSPAAGSTVVIPSGVTLIISAGPQVLPDTAAIDTLTVRR
jgi:beta-lactam-binding protein with PASTA domain